MFVIINSHGNYMLSPPFDHLFCPSSSFFERINFNEEEDSIEERRGTRLTFKARAKKATFQGKS
jgi:hypothetical protein